jgi:hypothetical protein
LHYTTSGRQFDWPFISAEVTSRETKEGWPLLTVETEMNRDSKSTNERGPFLAVSSGLSCRYKSCLFCVKFSSRPSTKYFFPHRTLFYFLWPHRPEAGQAAVLGRLSLSVYLWLPLTSTAFLSQEQSLCILSKQNKVK